MTGFHLLDKPNPHGPNFYSYRRMCQHGIPHTELPHLIVVHTAESLPDYTGPDTSGESLALYASTTDRAVSWHSTADSDGLIPMLPDNYTAFHVVDYNRCSIGVEFSTQAGRWYELSLKYPLWYANIMAQGANQVAWWCKVYGIAPRRLTKAQADKGERGVVAHADLDPGRRSDPGAAFAWERFLNDVNSRLTVPGYLDKDDWPTWAALAIQKAIDGGIMVGDGLLWNPHALVTRADLVLILERLNLLK